VGVCALTQSFDEVCGAPVSCCCVACAWQCQLALCFIYSVALQLLHHSAALSWSNPPTIWQPIGWTLVDGPWQLCSVCAGW
jgi:hypothetical protein